MVTYDFPFAIDDHVRVTAIDRPAVVDAVQLARGNSGMMIRVYFWDNSDRKALWVYPDELLLDTKKVKANEQ